MSDLPAVERSAVGGEFPDPRRDGNVVRLISLLRRGRLRGKLVLPSGEVLWWPHRPPDVPIGPAAPCVTIRVTRTRALRRPLTALSLGEAYLAGDVDIEVHGDPAAVFELRDSLRDGMSLRHVASL